MNIMVHDYAGHPFQVQLSRRLAERGHTVCHVYSSFVPTPRGNLIKSEKDSPNLEIIPIKIQGEFKKYKLFTRWLQEKQYGRLVEKEIAARGPDVVISGNSPIDSQRYIYRACNKLGIKFIFWVQDVHSIAISRILRRSFWGLGRFIGYYYSFLEKRLLQKSDQIIIITEDWISTLRPWGISADRINVIENWAPLGEMPLQPKQNFWSNSKDLDDKFVFLYSGTLGYKHNPELLVKLAMEFRSQEQVKIVVISEGLGAELIRERKKEEQLDNLLIFDYQPFDVLPFTLAAADVLIAILEKDAGEFSVPAKVLSYMCAGRPLLLAVPARNLSSKIVERSNSGFVVQPDDVQGFIEAARILYENSDLRLDKGRAGREYAERTFDIEAITNRFEDVLRSAF